MQPDSIERIRSATFPIARKGYEKREVERFLGKLADWLEAGGGDQARSDVVKRELGRVGEKTASILAAAEDSAAEILAEAEREATATLNRAREEAAEARESAEQEAGQAIAEAQARAKRVVDGGMKRREALESLISDLESRRDAVLADIEELASELRATASSHAQSRVPDAFATPAELDPEVSQRT
jgi:DivIVA domain-containing protein